MRDLMIEATKATYYEAWEERMLQIKDIDQKAYEWLIAIPTRSWCKHAFKYYSKCDVLMNNISEAFNSTILLAREKPIITMFEWIRTYLMGRFASLKEKLSTYHGDAMSKPRKRQGGGVKWKLVCNLGKAFEIGDTRWLPSHLRERILSCLCIDTIRENCMNYVISSLNGQNKWPKTNDKVILLPQYKCGPGRPKKLRRREPDEDPNPTKLRRTHTTNKCNRCHQFGHNSRTCKNPLVEHVQTKTTLGVELPNAQASATQGKCIVGRPSGTTKQPPTQARKGKTSARPPLVATEKALGR
ncbi:hypothetical protein CR513_62156, partial [Mucuna pruriens]